MAGTRPGQCGRLPGSRALVQQSAAPGNCFPSAKKRRRCRALERPGPLGCNRSAKGGPGELGVVRQRPFRAPHHSVSEARLVSGGDVPRPGQGNLAHHGVLFLDELAEFRRAVIEAPQTPAPAVISILAVSIGPGAAAAQGAVSVTPE